MEVTAMVDTVVAMAATVDTTARGLLMPRPLLMLSLATGTTAMDTVMDTAMEAMAMVDTVVDMVATVATTARDLLMLRPSVAMDTTARGLLMLSPAMDTTAVDMVAMDTAAATDTAMAMATTDKKLCVMQFRVQYKN